MLDHITFGVGDFDRALSFYDQALAPLGVERLVLITAEMTGGTAYVGYGEAGRPYFWFHGEGATTGTMHVAFSAASRTMVDAFYAAALAAGGTDNGAPGLRPHYDPNYYGAFVLDPEGRNIEAVCRKGE